MQTITEQTQCVKCGRELPTGAEWCPWCGRKQTRSTSTRRRSNGTGSIFRRGSGYIALKIIGHEIRPDGTRRRITKSKSGLRTRKEAEEWLHSPEVQDAGGKRRTAYTFQQLYDLWEPTQQAGPVHHELLPGGPETPGPHPAHENGGYRHRRYPGLLR